MAKKEITDLPRTHSNHTRKTLKVTLPIPPSVNAIYYNTRGGGRRLTVKAQHYIRDARALINLAIEEQKWSKQTKGTWVYVDMVYYFPDRRIRDASNCLKLLLDVLEGIVYENDMYALPRIQSVEYDKTNPRLELAVSLQNETQRIKGLKVTENVL